MNYFEGELNDPIPKNIRDQMSRQIEEWKRTDTKLFVKTERSVNALKGMEKRSCVVLTGGPGVGKTTIARHIALIFETNGYRIIPVLIPEDIRNFYQPGKKSIFYVDDMCGTYTANHRDMDNWKRLLSVIETILSDEYCKIIITCRLQIFLDERFKLLSPFQKCECNLNKVKLRKKEKKQMIKRYSISSAVLSTESKRCEFFPLLCSLYNGRVDAIKFFKTPFAIYRTELVNLGISSFESKCKLCGLALCVLFNNRIDEKWFQNKVEDHVKPMLHDAYGACGLNTGTSKDSIGKALKTLEGTYVCKLNGYYTILHDKLFDFLVYYFGQIMLECLIEHGASGLIRERFAWQKSTENNHNSIDFITEIPNQSLDMYMDRLIKDWANGRVCDVFHNTNLKCINFRTKFVEYLHKTIQLKLVNIMDTLSSKEDCCAGSYPIIEVCYHGYTDILQWLLDNGVDVNQKRNDGVTALIMASAHGNSEIVAMLCKQKADVNLCNNDEATALYMACQNGYISVVEQLLEKEIDVNFGNHDRETPLCIACRNGSKAIVISLLRKNPDVNKENRSGSNPLHAACCYRQIDVVSLLLESKNVTVNINACNVKGYTPLMYTCLNNSTDISFLLINANADVDIQSFDGASALCYAVGLNNLDTTVLLLKNKASWQIGFQTSQNWIDATVKHPEITLENVKNEIWCFVVKNVSPKVKDYVKHLSGDYIFKAMAGSSPLHIASFMGHTSIVSCLLDFDAYVDFAKEDGTTPLFYACELGHDATVRLLLDNGADFNIRRQDERSPLDIAECNGHRSVVTMLKEHRVD